MLRNTLFENVMQDVRYAFRMFGQNPGFMLVAVLSLALGIGANTAIFSLIDAVMLKMLPVKNPQQLVMLSDPSSSGVSTGTQSGNRSLYSYGEFVGLRSRNQIFSGMFAAQSNHDRQNVNIAGGAPEEVSTELVSGDYFSTLGVNALMGRTFTVSDEKAPGSDPYAVISYDFWKKRFGQDSRVLGKTIQIHKTFFTIIGVAPPGFFGDTVGEGADVWLPMMMEPQVNPGRDWLHDDPSHVERVMWLQVAGRLKPGVTQKRAEASLNVVFQQILRDGAGSSPSAERLRSFSQEKIQAHPGDKGASSLREQFSEPLMVLMTVVGLVLLIACANVANLLLARATARQKEIGIRLALGARKSRLVRQLLTESVMLALLGGALGVAFAYWGSRLLLQVVSQGPQPIPLDVHPDARILAFTAAVSILTGLLFGLAPALRATGVDVNSTLKESSRGVIGGRGRLGLGKALVISQVAISLLLLIGAGLFVRTLRNLETVDLGYPRDHLLIVGVDPTSAGYKGVQLGPVYHRILERFQTIPGVRAVTLSQNGLFSGSEGGDRIAVEGYKPVKEGDGHARFDQVGPDYFLTIGIPMLLGRGIEPRDTENSPYVCVINETMAKFFFGHSSPIGKHVTDLFPDTRITFEIVGVSKDDRDHGLRGEIQRRFYTPFFHALGGIPPDANFELRTFADPKSVIAAARKQVQQVDPSLPVNSVTTLDENLSRNLTQERLIAQLSAFFGLLALLLAAVGLYGVLSYAIARRTNEIGIRMALGASRAQVAGMILRETLTLVVIGTVIGVPVAIGASRLVTSRLYGLKGADPVTLIVAVLVLAIVAAAAAYVPARRASKVDPLVALRYE